MNTDVVFKKCTKCGEEKPADREHYHINKGGKYGLRSMCIPCWRSRVRELIKQPEVAAKRKEYASRYVESGENAKKNREWRKKNPDSARMSAIKWKEKNKDRIRETAQKCRDKNRDKYREKQRRVDAKLQTKPYHVLKKRFKARLRQMLKKKTVLGSSERLFGFTREKLVLHIENKFSEGMSWEALLRGEIHIDHIRPIASFNINSIEDPDFKACWSLDNLQPLWAKDNLLKGSSF